MNVDKKKSYDVAVLILLSIPEAWMCGGRVAMLNSQAE
jgi:hypothetical protein